MTERKNNPAEEPANRSFVISRVFDVPRDLVFNAWTESEHLKQWFGPKGFSLPACKNDPRPGGVFHYCMRAPDGAEMWGKWTYREIVEPKRLVVIVSFSDAEGNVIRHPLVPDWPLETLSTTTFVEHEGETILTIEWAPFSATESERRCFEAGHEGMTQGWAGTLDQLAAYLSQKKP
jgi:uncharacterized protein YndB with AHSA1/START domain